MYHSWTRNALNMKSCESNGGGSKLNSRSSIGSRPWKKKNSIEWPMNFKESLFPQDIRVNRRHLQNTAIMYFHRFILVVIVIPPRVWSPHLGSITASVDRVPSSFLHSQSSYRRMAWTMQTNCPQSLSLDLDGDLPTEYRPIYPRVAHRVNALQSMSSPSLTTLVTYSAFPSHVVNMSPSILTTIHNLFLFPESQALLPECAMFLSLFSFLFSTLICGCAYTNDLVLLVGFVASMHLTSTRSNRYSMPVTSSMTRKRESVPDYTSVMGIGPINTTGFLFGEDDEKSSTQRESATSPDVKNYIQMNTTDDKFPILVRNNEHPGLVSVLPYRIVLD